MGIRDFFSKGRRERSALFIQAIPGRTDNFLKNAHQALSRDRRAGDLDVYGIMELEWIKRELLKRGFHTEDFADDEHE